MVVVEVLTPSTAADDHGVKLDGYFSLPSVEHHLIVDADRRMMIHHKRGQAGAIETRVLRDGLVRLDPPGLEAEVAAFFVTESGRLRRDQTPNARRKSSAAHLFCGAPTRGRQRCSQ